jgi:hypothetical protein
MRSAQRMDRFSAEKSAGAQGGAELDRYLHVLI